MSLYTYIGTPNSNLVSTIQPLSKSQGKKIDCHRFVVSASKSFSALYTKPTLSLSIRTPFTEPMTTITCTHTFCFECIHQALHHAPLCPIDRSPLCELDLVPADPIIRSVRPQKNPSPSSTVTSTQMVEELEVECVHFGISKCDWKGQRQCLVRHLRDECKYGEVECGEDGCRVVVVRQDLERHQEEGHGASPLDPGEQVEPVSCFLTLSNVTILLYLSLQTLQSRNANNRRQ